MRGSVLTKGAPAALIVLAGLFLQSQPAWSLHQIGVYRHLGGAEVTAADPLSLPAWNIEITDAVLSVAIAEINYPTLRLPVS